MKNILIAVLLAAFTFAARAAEPEFQCVISSERTSYALLEHPEITCRIINKTAKEVVLVKSLDGSETPPMRSPECRFEILDAKGRPVADGYARCGNTSDLKVTDFVAVASGASF
ncbi:MAG TPA: hypothetical protein VF585_07190, partial [Chthoniobacterales bacterium]